MVILSLIFAPFMPGPSMEDAFGPSGTSSGSSEGMFGNMQRQAAIVAEAEEDTYSPPSDGKLTDRQVQNYASTMATVAGIRAESMKRMEALAEEAEKDESVSCKRNWGHDGGNVGIQCPRHDRNGDRQSRGRELG